MSRLATMYRDGMSLTQIARETGTPVSTVRCRLLSEGVRLRTRAEGIRLAASQGRIPFGGSGTRDAEQRQRIAAARQRWARENAKGWSVKPNGYVECTTGPNKGRTQHRIVMEQHLGRPLHADELVHHIDHDRSNNDISNLRVMTRAEHARLHALGMDYDRDELGRFASGDTA